MKLLDGLFDPQIRHAHGDPRVDWPAVWPIEEAALHRAAESRRREFRAGRTCAREAMLALAAAPAAIAVRADRSPAWPDGLVGSISHCHDLCIAAVGRIDQGWLAIGIDVEAREAMPPELVPEICGPEEQNWFKGLPIGDRGDYATLIFSAKECAYKCQHTLSGRLLDFTALTICIDPPSSQFTARFNHSAAPFLAGHELVGRYRMDAHHIVTAIALSRQQMTANTAGQQEASSVPG
jgi:4'-phosphopantetheinyl transferase EntD